MLDRPSVLQRFYERVDANASWRSTHRLNVISDAGIPSFLGQAAKFCGLDCMFIPPPALLSGQALSGDIVWAVVTDADANWLGHLIERQIDEHFPLILQADLTSLDAVIHVASDLPHCSITVSPDEPAAIAALAGYLREAHIWVSAPSENFRDQQIESLQEEVQRISRLLARLAMDPPMQREPPSPFIDDHVNSTTRAYLAESGNSDGAPTISSRDVRQVIRQRRLREELFDSELFAHPAWDMLLDLYAAKLDRSKVAVSSLYVAAAVPAATALRWIKSLTETGMFERTTDQHDARRIFVQLSDKATQAMHCYFARLSDLRLAI